MTALKFITRSETMCPTSIRSVCSAGESSEIDRSKKSSSSVGSDKVGGSILKETGKVRKTDRGERRDITETRKNSARN